MYANPYQSISAPPAPATSTLFSDAFLNRGKGARLAGLFQVNDDFGPWDVDGTLAEVPISLLYKRPTLNLDQRLFSDLTLYAPALNTSDADIQTVLEAELKVEGDRLPASGPIEPAARSLIDRARSDDWKYLHLGKQRININGAGQFSSDTVLPSGLRQHVVCDGKTLLHVYPDIGLAAPGREPFHRAELAAAVPWHVLPAEDLARGAELKVVDERTVAVRPLPAARSHSEVHLVFADAGRLRERRVVEMPAGKVVLRQTFDGQGTVSTDSPSSNLPAATLKLDVGPTRAPNLKPDLKELVVVPMPLRTREHLYSRLKPGTQSTLASLDADTAISLIAAESLQHNCDKALQIFGERFHCRKDRRPGFYTLLLSGQNWSASAQSMANPQSPGQFPYTACRSPRIIRLRRR